jgi:uncharacterized protein YpmS
MIEILICLLFFMIILLSLTFKFWLEAQAKQIKLLGENAVRISEIIMKAERERLEKAINAMVEKVEEVK